MTGYLRRLAIRSLRPVPTVRSALSLPFAQLPTMEETAVESVRGSESEVASPDAAIAGSLVSTTINNSTGVSDGLESSVSDVQPDVAVPNARGHLSLERPTGKPQSSAPIRPSTESKMPQPEQTSKLTRARSIQTATQEVRDDSFDQGTPLVFNPVRAALDLSTSQDAGRSTFSPLVKSPLPRHQEDQTFRQGLENRELVPPLVVSPRTHAQASRRHVPVSGMENRARRKETTQRPNEEPTEVHVTIGRIEVTAVHAPPAPKREPEPKKKLMSLDEYLASRQKGRT
jgi:hypothetical protein